QANVGGRLVSAVEHESVLKAAPDATLLPVGPDGALDLAELERELRAGGRALVAMQAINSETGGSQDFEAIADRVARARGLCLIEDRKSTRLYSSQVKNSYSVFCLKKNKT